MPDITTDRFSEAQERILQHRNQASALYPALWRKMIAEWNAPDPQDRVWLTYSANYLFRTDQIRWAIDPFILDRRLSISARMDIARDIHNLSFVLLTHAHADHLDLKLIAALRHLPIIWVVPEFLLSEVSGEPGLMREYIIVPSVLTPIELHGLKILPFDGLHWETTPEGTIRGVPSLGYLVESRGRRWLFPGDTRTFHSGRLPQVDPVDVTFAHLWLGRGGALEDPPPLLDAFCRFFLDSDTRHIVLTHINELGRDAQDYWHEGHARLVCSHFGKIAPDVLVTYLLMGGSFAL